MILPTRLLALIGWCGIVFLAQQAPAQSAAGRVLSAEEKKQLLEHAAVAQKTVDAWDAAAGLKLVPAVLMRKLGEENVRKQFKADFDECKASGMRFLETTFGDPTPVHVSEGQEVCFLPRTSIIQTPDKKVRSTAYWVAVRELGSEEWKFLDGAPVNANQRALWGLFPSLPEDLTLPEWKQEPL